MEFQTAIFTEHLKRMIQYPTVSRANEEEMDFAPFFAFHEYLKETYPLVHQRMKKEIVGICGLLYHYESSRKSGRLPLMLIAHQDVVPEGDPGLWKYPPFEGVIENDILYGRGTTDSKCNIQAYMDALELLFAEGFDPDYDIYLGFGYNEEIMGGKSPAAQLIVKELEKRGISLGCVIDECGGIRKNKDGSTLANLYICEKGYADFEFSVSSKGGHSAYPLGSSALGFVADAICKIEANQMEPKLTAPVAVMLKAMAPYLEEEEMRELCRDVEGNWEKILQIAMTNNRYHALVRTTTAVTMASGSAQANILPEKAWAIVNNRLLPGETIEDLEAHYHSFLSENINIRLVKGSNPPAVQSCDTYAYRTIEKVVKEMYPGTVMIPSIMCGGTDSRYYCGICPENSVYRFTGIVSSDDERTAGAHQVNEHIDTRILAGNVEFYVRLLQAYGK